jgi:hypothetical protein
MKSIGSGLENRDYCRGDPLRLPRDTLFAQNLVLNCLTRASGLKVTEFVSVQFSLKESVRALKFVGRVPHIFYPNFDLQCYASASFIQDIS